MPPLYAPALYDKCHILAQQQQQQQQQQQPASTPSSAKQTTRPTSSKDVASNADVS